MFSVIRNGEKIECNRLAAITEWSLRIELLPKRIVAPTNVVSFRVNFISSVTKFKAHERRTLDISASLKLQRNDRTMRS
jgi:hypothetical protein